ncbi:TIGR02677 family protein [Embleya sp. NPDC020630]|uniref:TIGR02677 family protein n=1 Tax=Embleya sp. NPDC020630 TaxID=3363979 RepID=UPI00378E22CA
MSSDDEVVSRRPFSYLTAQQHSALYRAIMGVFVEAKQRFLVHLRPEDVQAALVDRVELSAVAAALDSLAGWGNLRADADTGRVTSVEDFYRHRYLYQLTREGEAVEEALSAYDAALGRRGALQAVALADIATQLRALIGFGAAERLDEGKVHLALITLTHRFNDLADNARAFMGSLQRTIDLHDADVEVFLAYKDRLIDYLERFIADLVTRGAQIAGLLDELGDPRRDDGPLRRLLVGAAEREAGDAAPDPTLVDAEPEGAEAAVRRALYETWVGRWLGLRAWFIAEGGHESQARLLRSRARSAVPQLLTVVGVLNERRAGRSDRSADFRALALWFAQAPDDASRHRLWRSAFGLHAARHLTVDAQSLAAREQDPPAAGTPWHDAPPIHISPQLRKTGSYERRGKPNRVADRSDARRFLAEHAHRERVQLAAARALLATHGVTRLGRLPELDPVTFGLFLHLLGDALALWRPETTHVVATGHDGSMEIHLTLPDDDARAEVHTTVGVFSGPDFLIEIIDLGEPGEPGDLGTVGEPGMTDPDTEEVGA